MAARPKDWWHRLQDGAADARLAASDKAVFARRLMTADWLTGELPTRFTEPQAKVARKTGLTVRQVRRAERHLELHGWLKISGTTGPGKTRSYTLALGTDCDCTGRVHEHVTADTMSAEQRTPTADTPQVRDQFPLREHERPGVREGKTEQQPLRNGDRITCPWCGAEGTVGERLVEHKPDCWRGGMNVLYDREAGA